MPRTRRPYPPEFREQLVALVRAGRTPEDLAGEFEPTAKPSRRVGDVSAVSRARCKVFLL